MHVFQAFALALAGLVHFLGQPGEELETKHLLMGDAEACAIGEVLGDLDCQVGASRPIQTKQQSHYQQDRGITQCGEAE